MSVSPQKKLDFKKRLEKLANGSFDDNDINWLLINSRPFSRGILYELACFIAHPEPRNQGMSFDFIERTCVKFNFLFDNHQQDYFQMLDVFFERILVPSIDDVNDKILKEEFSFSKKQAKKFIKEMYRKSYGFYNINCIDVETTNKALSLARMLGTSVMIKHTIDPKQMLSEFAGFLNRVSSMIGSPIDGRKLVREFESDIYLCVSSLIHGCAFAMPDKLMPKVKLRFVLADNSGPENRVRLSPFVSLPSFNKDDKRVITLDMMFLDYDVSKYVLEEQKEMIRDGLEIETMELFRNDGGQLKIRILDHQYVET